MNEQGIVLKLLNLKKSILKVFTIRERNVYVRFI